MTKREMKRWKKSKKNYKLPWAEYTVFSYVVDTIVISYATKNTLIDEYHKVYTKVVELKSSAILNKKVPTSYLKPVISEPQVAKHFDNAFSKGDDVISFDGDFGTIYIGPVWLYDALQKEAS